MAISRYIKGWCALTLALCGCAAPKMDLEAMKKMPLPPRPAELDLLEPMVGTWQSTGEFEMTGLDKKLSGSGTQTVSWDCDRRILVEHMQWDMPEMGANGKMTGMCMYALEDAREKEFHVVWASSMGDLNTGEMKYNEKTSTWHLKARGKNPMSGQTVLTRGTMKMPDSSTMEWTHEEWDSMGLCKQFVMKGVSKKK